MRATARFVGLDLRSMQPNVKYMIIPLVITVVPVLLFFGPYMVIPAVCSLAVVSAPSYLFSNDERGRLDTLYAALGIPRRHVVAGRYATCLLALVVLTIVGFLLAKVAALTFGVAFDWTIGAALAVGCFAFVGLLLAAQLPVLFATGPGSVRNAASIPPGLILTVIFLAWAIPDVRAVMLSWLGGANLAWLALAAIALLAVLVAISTALAARQYARRDL